MDTDKYIHIYRKAVKGDKGFGDLTDVRVGDVVGYRDDNGAHASGRVAKVNVKAGVLRTEVQKYEQYVLRYPKTLKFDQILNLSRLNPLSEKNPDLVPNVIDLFVPEPPAPEPIPVKRKRKTKP